jgi:hypothetical protein
MSHIWQNAERELAALRARVAELEAEAAVHRVLNAEAHQWREQADQERDAALATLERVRDALTRRGDEPAIDTLARIEAALR